MFKTQRLLFPPFPPFFAPFSKEMRLLWGISFPENSPRDRQHLAKAVPFKVKGPKVGDLRRKCPSFGSLLVCFPLWSGRATSFFPKLVAKVPFPGTGGKGSNPLFHFFKRNLLKGNFRGRQECLCSPTVSLGTSSYGGWFRSI